MSFPSKEDREKCWTSRDELWKCLDENNGDQAVCSKFREMYVNSCPSQWVKHFDRKREYLKFKDRIYKEGNHSPTSCSNSCNESSANPVGTDLEGRRIIAVTALETDPDGITIELVGAHHHHLLSVNGNQSSSSTSSLSTSSSCNSAAVRKSPSPRIFRKFQPPTFS